MKPETRAALFTAVAETLMSARDLDGAADEADSGIVTPIVSSMLSSALLILQTLQANGQPAAPAAPARLNPSHR